LTLFVNLTVTFYYRSYNNAQLIVHDTLNGVKQVKELSTRQILRLAAEIPSDYWSVAIETTYQ